MRRHNLRDFSEPSQYIWGDVKTFKPVSAAYRDQFASNNVIEEPEPEVEEPVETPEEPEETPVEVEEEVVNADDSAKEITASLMTLGLASVYALLA